MFMLAMSNRMLQDLHVKVPTRLLHALVKLGAGTPLPIHLTHAFQAT